MVRPQRIVVIAVAFFHFVRSLLLRLGRPVLNKLPLPSNLGTTKAMEETDASNVCKRGMDGMAQFIEYIGDTSQPAATDADKHGCSSVLDARYPDECFNNVEHSDDWTSKQSEDARRVRELEEENAILQQKIIRLQEELRLSDACLAFRKDEYNTMISVVRNFFSVFKPHEKASAVPFIKAEGNQQVACMKDLLSYLALDRKFGIKYQRRKKKSCLN
ncbi:unnamed protein product [Urochloa decumbens]|uniref:Uncharacterized protein n=1 Tax=Urochloa decumbens TaxID=240449 RepID=A0ABC8X125_9POAL